MDVTTLDSEVVMNRAWYIFRVNTNKETRASEYVERAGYTTALPKVIHRVRISRHATRRADKAFPGLKSYLLVGFNLHEGQNPQDHFWQVRRQPYMRDPVGTGCYASRVPCENVRDFLNNGRWDQRSVEKLIRNWQPDYCAGDVVGLKGIASGAVRGIVRSIDLPSRMAQIEIDLLGKPNKINWPADKCFYSGKGEDEETKNKAEA